MTQHAKTLKPAAQPRHESGKAAPTHADLPPLPEGTPAPPIVHAKRKESAKHPKGDAVEDQTAPAEATKTAAAFEAAATAAKQTPKEGFFKRMFRRKPKAEQDPVDHRHTQAAFAEAERRNRKHRKKLDRHSLQQYLDKAGYELNAEHVKRLVLRSVVGIFLGLTIALLTFAVLNGAYAWGMILFLFGMWTAVFAATMLLIYGVVYFFLDYRIYTRTRELEEVLPDYLQLASSNIAAGMSIDNALWYAIRPNFGVLAKEMEEVAKATMAGEDLETSLVRLTEKYDSTVLKRSVNILIEGMRAGGEMADLLNKIALNIDEMRIMKKEMAASVTTYAIFITFASVVIAPFLFALATQLLEIIIKIASSLETTGSGGLTLARPDPEAVGNFQTFSIIMLIISTVFSASIVSVIKRGNVMEGIKSIPVYAIAAVTLYFLGCWVLAGLFGNII